MTHKSVNLIFNVVLWVLVAGAILVDGTVMVLYVLISR
jgi:hypothetical protein